ncbi:MAG TPA: RdgB/HAM1 family non-canonical purine NTP pyrophosphatase [Tepidisphaeraceae bacterium]
MRLLIATANPGKVKEFHEMLGSDRFQWSDLSQHKDLAAPEETGKTFRANACLKASYYATRSQSWAVADDSGLAVDALGGAPGVMSARWAQLHRAGVGDAANNALLLQQAKDVPDQRRTARFVCCLALSDPQGRIILTAQDSVEGVLLREARGTKGFGYDPLFYFPQLGKTTAELEPDQKHAISHRGKALRHLRSLMDRAGWSGETGVDAT